MKTRCMMVSKLGGALSAMDVEVPHLLSHEVQVDVLACSVNFADTLIVQGTYQEKPELPFSPGMEVVGVIREVGQTVASLRIGQKILAYVGYGGMSEVLNIPASYCIPIADDADPVIFASLPIAYGTSHLALFHRAKLKAEETLVVLGASGGVGLTAVELGVKAGANVIACARGEEKLAVAGSKGAHHLLDAETDDLRTAILELGGADVVYDPVGGAQFKSVFRACNPEARVLPIGFASGDVPQIPANILLVKNISVIGFYWGGYRKFAVDVLAQSLREIIEWTEKGQLTPHISNVHSLGQANEALALLSQRKATGKVVIDLRLPFDG